MFAVLSSIASIALLLLLKSKKYIFLLSGMLIVTSFINPKAVFSTIICFLLLWGFKKIDLTNIISSLSMGLAALGPLLWPSIYKMVEELLRYLKGAQMASVNSYVLGILYWLSTVRNFFFLFNIVLGIIVLLLIFINMRRISDKENVLIEDDISFSQKFALLFIILSIIIFLFVILYLYNLLPYSITEMINNVRIFNKLMNFILRYHIMFLLSVFTLFFKLNRRILLVILLLAVSFYVLGVNFSILPISILILSLPALYQLVKCKKIIILVFLFYIVIGIFTNGLFSIPIGDINSDPIFFDTPHVTKILLEFPDNVKIYPGSHYNYFVRRTAGFGDLKITKNIEESKICLIDKDYAIKKNLNISKILYSGKRLVLVILKD